MTDPRGYLCKKCQCSMRVETVRRPVVGVVVRYRLCPMCGHRCRTEEREKAVKQKKS